MKCDDLIIQLAAATVGTRELDRYIFHMIEITPRQQKLYKKWSAEMQRHKLRHDFDWYAVNCSPKFTKCTDAALTILPAWASFELTQSAAGPPTFTRCRLWDWRRGPTMSDPGNEWKAEGNRPLPVNIVIAALKMRQNRP